MRQIDRVGLFGGTFNPPTRAHAAVAQAAVAALDLDLLLICPNRLPVHKPLAGAVDAEARLALCEAMCAGRDGWQTTDVELVADGPSYTSQTARWLADRYPQARRFLIGGTDSIGSLADWHEPQVICDLMEVVMASRGGEPPIDGQTMKAALPGLRLHTIEVGHPVSSTQVRELLAAGRRDQAAALMEDPVCTLVQTLGLYRS